MIADMRIIAGSAGGRRIKSPSGDGTRPTSDRVREALFSILGAPPPDATVLDLFAGSGGLGLEALSRGASHATFVDRDAAALAAVRDNLRSLKMEAQASVIKGEAVRTLQRLASREHSFHWVFLDPPYATDLANQALRLLGEGALLSPEGLVIVEHDHRRAPDGDFGFLVKGDTRRYGDTGVTFFERKKA